MNDDLILVEDVETSQVGLVTRKEAAAGMIRYARSLGPGTPACAEWERRAIEILSGKDEP